MHTWIRFPFEYSIIIINLTGGSCCMVDLCIDLPRARPCGLSGTRRVPCRARSHQTHGDSNDESGAHGISAERCFVHSLLFVINMFLSVVVVDIITAQGFFGGRRSFCRRRRDDGMVSCARRMAREIHIHWHNEKRERERGKTVHDDDAGMKPVACILVGAMSRESCLILCGSRQVFT